MSCVMRADGASFDVDAFCAGTVLPVIAKHRAGEVRPPRARPSIRSSVNIRVSDADFDDVPQQIEDAIGFLERHAEAVRQLVGFPGVDGATLDFGVKRRDVAAQSDAFPGKLVCLAGALGLGITVSQYEVGPA